MAGPTVSDLLSMLRSQNKISQSDFTEFLVNYDYFQNHRAQIEQAYRGSWVATLNDQIYAAPSFRELMAKLKSLPNHRLAYIESLPR
jgi:hypothetical protein